MRAKQCVTAVAHLVARCWCQHRCVAGHPSCRVKFGAFLEHLESGHAGCFDRVASGHYASVTQDPGTGAATLCTTADAVKDQTYFLAHLNQVCNFVLTAAMARRAQNQCL